MNNNGNLIAIIITGILFYIGKSIHEWREQHGNHAPSLSHMAHETLPFLKSLLRRETPHETAHEPRRDEPPETFDDIEDETESEEQYLTPIVFPDDVPDENHVTGKDNPCKAWVREQLAYGERPGTIITRGYENFKYSRAQINRYMKEIREGR